MKTANSNNTVITALIIFLGTGAVAWAQMCVVNDPTGTPLNVRTTPNGRIMTSLVNGTKVFIQRISYDNLDRPWVLISVYQRSGYRTLGWVFRPFLSCGK